MAETAQTEELRAIAVALRVLALLCLSAVALATVYIVRNTISVPLVKPTGPGAVIGMSGEQDTYPARVEFVAPEAPPETVQAPPLRLNSIRTGSEAPQVTQLSQNVPASEPATTDPDELERQSADFIAAFLAGQTSAAQPKSVSSGQDKPSAAIPAPKRKSELGVLDVKFDLGGKGTNGEALELTKPMMLNGQPVGKAVIKIEGEKNIFLRSDAVNVVISKAPANVKLDSLETLSERIAFVSVEQLRQTGLDVSYNPIQDRIEIKSKVS